MNIERRGHSAAPPHPYRATDPNVEESTREVGPRYAAFRTHVQCPGCARPVPVNGPKLGVDCPFCAAEISLQARRITKLTDLFEREHAELEGTARTLARVGGGLQCRVRGVEVGAHRGLDEVPVPEWLSAACPTASRVWVCRQVEPEDRSPIGFACPSCAHGLSLDHDAGRVMRCDGCGGRVFVPESLWQELHGPVRIETWVVEFRGENVYDRARRMERDAAKSHGRNAAAASRYKAEAAARLEAARAAATAEDLGRLGRQGNIMTGMHAAVLLVAIAIPWLLQWYGASDTNTTYWVVGSVFAVWLAGGLGLFAGGRVITRATGDRDLVFPVWFNYVFTVSMPAIGHLLGLEAIHGLRWGQYAKRYGRHANLAALNWALISFGGLAHIASLIVAFTL